MGASTNVLTLASGAIVFSGANNATLQNGQIGATNAELFVHQ